VCQIFSPENFNDIFRSAIYSEFISVYCKIWVEIHFSAFEYNCCSIISREENLRTEKNIYIYLRFKESFEF
jgi:hypothetical protein